MKKVNIFEAKARLSEYLELVKGGERVVICKRNRPIAELRAVAAPRATERPVGGTQIDLTEVFFQPLPADIEEAFYAPALTSGRGASTAAEGRTRSYRARKTDRRSRR